MGGKEARDGFWFQDAMALLRILTDAIDRRARRGVGEPPGEVLELRVEATVTTEANTSSDAHPIWDSTYTTGCSVIVDESKKGGPEKKDRIDFYRRIRRTVATGVSARNISPRFTVERNSRNPDAKWHGLAVAAATATPSNANHSIGNATELASEALYYLTANDVSSSTGADQASALPSPISLSDARALLGRLIFDNTRDTDDVENDLRSALDSIGAECSADQLVNALAGWIARVARLRDPVAVTAESLLHEIKLLRRYLDERPEVEALWHRLRKFSPTLPSSTIAKQSWRDVQPTVACRADSDADHRLILTAAGGVGKSFVLIQMHGEILAPRVWINAETENDGIEDALSFGSWACHQRGEKLNIYIDGFDFAKAPTELLAVVERSLTERSARVFVAARVTKWASIRDRFPGWTEISVSPWSEELVRKVADAGRTSRLSPDLVQLLRTPLLLDLFVRTFNAQDPVPEGLSSRYGVLKAYYDHRILKDDGSNSVEIRIALDTGAKAIVDNRSSWLDNSPAAHGLLSDGVFVQSSGRYSFRHALLRDYATSLFLGSLRETNEMVEQLKEVANPAIRNDILRALVESLMSLSISNDSKLEDLVIECAARGLVPGIAIGSMDSPTGRFVEAIATIEHGTILRQAIQQACLSKISQWISAIAGLGEVRPPWLKAPQLEAMSYLAKFADETDDVAAIRKLARTLRAWTFNEVGNIWPIANILKLITRMLPDAVTLEWLAKLQITSDFVASEILDPVRRMTVDSADLNAEPAGRALSNLLFGSKSQRVLRSHDLWVIENKCLLTRNGKTGILAARPEIGLPIVFELSAAHGEAERKQRAADTLKLRTRPNSASLDQFFKTSDNEGLAIARGALPFLQMLTEDEAMDGLVNDISPASLNPRYEQEIGGLLRVAETLALSTSTFETVVTAAFKSRSANARMIVLGASMQLGNVAMIERVLSDRRIFHVGRRRMTLPNIRKAIEQYWPTFSSEARTNIQKNILDIARGPLLCAAAVGDLAQAIPSVERDARFAPYTDFSRAMHAQSETKHESKATVDNDEYSAESYVEKEMSSVRSESPYARFLDATISPASEEAAQRLRELIDNDLFEEKTPQKVWGHVGSVLGNGLSPQRLQLIDSVQARYLFEKSIERAAKGDIRADSQAWGALIYVADACALHDENRANRDMRLRLVAEVANAAEHEFGLVTIALAYVSDEIWSTDEATRELFRSWLRGPLNVEGLFAAMLCLPTFGSDTQLQLVQELLESETEIDSEYPEWQKLFREAGAQLAHLVLQPGESAARALFKRWCESPDRPGRLNKLRFWRELLGGFTWALERSLIFHITSSRELSGSATIGERYAEIAQLVWTAWSAIEIDGTEAIAFALLSPLKFEYSSDPRSWEKALRPLFFSILRSGGVVDLTAALPTLSWDELDRETLIEATATMMARWQAGQVDEKIARLFVAGLATVGILQNFPRHNACAVLDCLYSIGTTVPEANEAALRVEERIRAEQD